MPTHFQSQKILNHPCIHVVFIHLGSPEKSWYFVLSGTSRHSLWVPYAHSSVAHTSGYLKNWEYLYVLKISCHAAAAIFTNWCFLFWI